MLKTNFSSLSCLTCLPFNNDYKVSDELKTQTLLKYVNYKKTTIFTVYWGKFHTKLPPAPSIQKVILHLLNLN